MTKIKGISILPKGLAFNIATNHLGLINILYKSVATKIAIMTRIKKVSMFSIIRK